MDKVKALFNTWQWLTIIGGILVTAVGWTAFAFTTFEQKSDLKDVLSQINDRLARIEKKL